MGGIVSFALLALLTKVFNSHENFILTVVFSIAAFVLIGSSVTMAVFLAAPGVRQALGWLIVAVVFSAIIGGTIFPFGVFGYWLSLLPLAVITPLALHGLSSLTLKSIVASTVGLLCGGIAATVWILVFSFVGQTYLEFARVSSWVPFGLLNYGFTLGLLMWK